jgi:hydroxyacylglutathione hydrolase
MKVDAIYAKNTLRNFSYLISDDHQNAVCIDPFDGSQIHQMIKQKHLNLKAIINTHQHYDHTRGNAYLERECGAMVLAVNDLKTVWDDYLPGVNLLNCFHAPGHTMDHYCLLLSSKDGKEKALFSGDTLFNGGVGNCKNGGKVESLYHTIYDYFILGGEQSLPGEAYVYTGHDYFLNNIEFSLSLGIFGDDQNSLLAELQSLRKQGQFKWTTLKEEREINPFLNLDQFSKHPDFKNLTKKDIFIRLRALRDQW